MDRTPCFNTLAAERHISKIEGADANLEDLHAELTHAMQRALAGLQGHVPGFAGYGGTTREIPMSAADEVVSALDHMTSAEALMLVLKDSACPLVAKLRLSVIDRYVENNADCIAEARGVA